MFLIAGNRRILSYLKAVERARDDGTFKKTQHLQTIDAVLYHGINPENRAALSLIENEERSDNPVATWKTIQALKDQGKWDEVAEIYQLNSGRLSKFNKFAKIDQVFLDAHLEGKIAKGNLESIASLNSTRQGVLKKTLTKKGKLVKNDIRDAKSTQVTKALKKMPALPALKVQPQETYVATPDYYTILDLTKDPVIAHQVSVYDNFTEALTLLKDGEKLYKLVEV
jgi:ParB-like chromosome segregation protein Spo0J